MKDTLKAIGIAALVVTVILVTLVAFFLWKADFSVLGDKGYIVSGKIYEWRDAPNDATSEMYLVESAGGGNTEQILEKLVAENINDINIMPIENARILIEPKSWVEDKGWGYFESYKPADMSDNSGNVTSFWIGSTRPEVFLIKVTKSGYKEVVEEANMSRSNVTAVVAILVKEQ